MAENWSLCLQTLQGHSRRINAMGFSPDGKMLASGSDDKTIKVWDISSGKALQTLEGHSGGVSVAAFSIDSKTLASGSTDNTVKLWDTSSGEVVETFDGRWDSVNQFWPRLASPWNVENDWICCSWTRALWIPSEYRPSIFAFSDDIVGFGYPSGQILILRFVI